MLSEIAINDREAFKKLVEVAKSGKVENAKVETKKVETKKEEKKETTDLSKLTVAELREMAKKANVEGFSTMKKADLLAALNK